MFDFFQKEEPPIVLLRDLPFGPITRTKMAMCFYEDAFAKRKLRVPEPIPQDIPANKIRLFIPCLIYEMAFLAVAVSESKARILTVPISGNPIFNLLGERILEYVTMASDRSFSKEQLAAAVLKDLALPKLMFDNGRIQKRKFQGMCALTIIAGVLDYFGLSSELKKDLLPPKRFRDVLDALFEINRRGPYTPLIDQFDWAPILANPRDSGLIYWSEQK
jgi:hypothetical protein